MYISTDFYRKSCALTYKMFVAAIHNRPSPLEGGGGGEAVECVGLWL